MTKGLWMDASSSPERRAEWLPDQAEEHYAHASSSPCEKT